MVRTLILPLFSILCFAAGAIHGQATSKSAVSKAVTLPPVSNKLVGGRVTDVENGDCLTLKTSDGALYALRLQGVDAPDEKQNNFKKSRKNLTELVMNKDVTAILHRPDGDGRRYVASVFMNGRDIGLLQIEMGMAWHYKRHSLEQTASSRKLYTSAETTAKTSGLGLWEDKNPQAPWVFRGEDPTPVQPTVVRVAESQIPTSNTANDGKKYTLGPRGGCYYVSESGRKVYVKDKNLCLASESVNKP